MKKYALQEQLNSPTIVQSLTDLLRRAPNCAASQEFKISLEQVKQRKRLHLGSPFFLKNLCWTAVLSPSSTNSTAYDLQLHHQSVTDVFEHFYTGYIEVCELPADSRGFFPRMSASQIEDGVGTFRNFLHEKMFKDATTDLKFRIKLFLTECPITHASFFEHECTENLAEKWRKDGNFRFHFFENMLLIGQEMALPLHEALAKYLSRLLSEETMKRCCVEDWAHVIFCFMKAVGETRSPATYMTFSRAGILKLIAKLFAADLSQMSSIPVIVALNMLLTDQMHKDLAVSDPVVQPQICEALDLAFVNIMPKFSDTRYPLEILCHFSLHVLPNIMCYRFKRVSQSGESLLHSKMCITAFESLEHLLPFLDYRTVLDLAEMDPSTLFCDIDNSIFLCDILTVVYTEYFEANADKVPTPVEKKLLETICENLTNPFYPMKELVVSICILHGTIGQKRTILKDWCLKNSDRKPFLSFATTMETGLDVLHMIISMDDDEEVRKQLIEEFDQFFLFLRACYNSMISTEPGQEIEENIPIEKVKANANCLHRSGMFFKAIGMYTCVIVTSETFARRLRMEKKVNLQKVFYYIDLANICHNNRAGSFMELNQPQLALADVVFVINEIQSLVVGDHVYIRGYKPSSSELINLKERLVKAKFRRLKLVAALSLWIPALRNSINLLENHPDRPHETLKYYYHSLLKYSATTYKVQYPPFCIMCYARKGKAEKLLVDVYSEVKMKCKKCRHGYCSEECYRKDTTHKTYCAKLAKLRASKAKSSNR